MCNPSGVSLIFAYKTCSTCTFRSCMILGTNFINFDIYCTGSMFKSGFDTVYSIYIIQFTSLKSEIIWLNILRFYSYRRCFGVPRVQLGYILMKI